MRKTFKRIRDASCHPQLESYFRTLDSPTRPEICPGYEVHYDSRPLGHVSIATTAAYTQLTEPTRSSLKSIVDKLMTDL